MKWPSANHIRNPWGLLSYLIRIAAVSLGIDMRKEFDMDVMVGLSIGVLLVVLGAAGMTGWAAYLQRRDAAKASCHGEQG